jgi:hypothetical protein
MYDNVHCMLCEQAAQDILDARVVKMKQDMEENTDNNAKTVRGESERLHKIPTRSYVRMQCEYSTVGGVQIDLSPT